MPKGFPKLHRCAKCKYLHNGYCSVLAVQKSPNQAQPFCHAFKQKRSRSRKETAAGNITTPPPNKIR